MSFDKLKEQWHQESSENIDIPDDLSKLRRAHTPIDLVRKTMRNEFFVQIFTLIASIFVPKILHFNSVLMGIYMFFYALMVVFTLYYFYKFFVFYKRSYDLTFDSRKNLLWFYYELKLNIELYKALTYILIFITQSFVIVAVFVINGNKMDDMLEKLSHISSSNIHVLLIAFAVMLVSFLLAESWSNFSYGKQLKRIKKVLDQLDE